MLLQLGVISARTNVVMNPSSILRVYKKRSECKTHTYNQLVAALSIHREPSFTVWHHQKKTHSIRRHKIRST